MNGPIMICWIAANHTDVNCNDYEGNNYDPPQPRSDGRDLTDPVQAGVCVADSGAANYIRFETIAGTNVKPPLDSNSTMPDYSDANFTLLHNTGFTRVIFGKGGWYDAFSGRVSRKQHDTDSSIAHCRARRSAASCTWCSASPSISRCWRSTSTSAT
jgi:hypothetical protein